MEGAERERRVRTERGRKVDEEETGAEGAREGVEFGGGAWKTRGRPWPRERVDGACARRDGAKRKVFQVPPPNSGRDGLLFVEAV